MATVVSLLAEDFDTLARAALRQAPLADLVELRLDRVGHPGEERLRALIAECPKPVIVTLHGSEAFGTFAGSVDERCETLLAAARAGARFVDVDWTLSLELGEVEAPCHRIVSRHELQGTPDDLAAVEEAVRAVLYEGDAIKLVTHAHCTEDGLRVLRHLRSARGGLIAFCSGAAGSFTRLLAPIFGSPFTYAAAADLPGSETLSPTAPGQLRIDELLGALPPGGTTPETAVLGVVGRPIAHSASPFVHGMALKSAHLDALYVAFEPRDFDTFLDLADDPSYRGLSVTAPFKERAFARAASVDAASRTFGAVNTLLRDGDVWRGHNTDLGAVRQTLEATFPACPAAAGGATRLRDVRVLVLGAGGAARSIVGALRELGVRPTLAGRDAGRARALALELDCDSIEWERIPELDCQVLVNATPVGTGGDGSPVPEHWIPEGGLVLDAVYRPIRTPLLVAAHARGSLAVPGAEWFVRQAEAQFELFTHQPPEEGLMRAALEGILARELA
ncbi:MAG: type I 3-dehydroquinate dehydratase [Planctomycetota bacterium]